MIAWSAIHGSLTTPGFVLYTSCVLWTMLYDTIYSHQVILPHSLAIISCELLVLLKMLPYAEVHKPKW